MPKFVDNTKYQEEKPEITEVKFYLSQSVYMQQTTDAEPKMVEATPDRPVVVTLPSHIYREGKGWYEQPETAFLTLAPKPEPKDVRPGVGNTKGIPKNLAKKVKGKRAADQ